MSEIHPQFIVAVIQARMSSSRLPGKAMRTIQGRSLLGHVVDRVRRCRSIDGLWIATSINADDDAVASFAQSEGLKLHRGPLDDVAGRLLCAARIAGAQALVRITADSPLVDPAIVDQAVTLFRREQPDLVTNVFPRTFPKGQSVEVIKLSALALAYAEMTTTAEREHVTQWFYTHHDRMLILNFQAPEPRGEMQLGVDTLEDLGRVEAILTRLDEPASSHGLGAILAAADAVQSTET